MYGLAEGAADGDVGGVDDEAAEVDLGGREMETVGEIGLGETERGIQFGGRP